MFLRFKKKVMGMNDLITAENNFLLRFRFCFLLFFLNSNESVCSCMYHGFHYTYVLCSSSLYFKRLAYVVSKDN